MAYGVVATPLAERTRHIILISHVAVQHTSGSQCLWWLANQYATCNMRVQRPPPSSTCRQLPPLCPPHLLSAGPRKTCGPPCVTPGASGLTADLPLVYRCSQASACPCLKMYLHDNSTHICDHDPCARPACRDAAGSPEDGCMCAMCACNGMLTLRVLLRCCKRGCAGDDGRLT